MPLSTIGTNQIADGAVAVADIADGSVTTAKIADNAVTTAKVNPAQTDITSVGTLTSFRSTGIDDNADALAITISSGENVGIGVVPETTWNSNIDALQLGLGASIYGDNTATGLQMSANTVATLGSSLNGYKYIGSDKATTYQQYDGEHNFRVASSGSADGAITWSNALTINNSGNVGIGTASPTSKLEAHSSGATNIVAKSTNGNGGYLNYTGLTSGGSTTFSVTHNGRVYAGDGILLGGTGNVNLLDDYEEGTAFAGIQDDSGNAYSFYEQNGQYNRLIYTKIGRLVFFTIYFYTSSTSGTTSSQQARITGLPFTSFATNPAGFSIIHIAYGAMNTSSAIVMSGQVLANNTIIKLYKQDTDGDYSALTIGELGAFFGQISGMYHAS